MMTGFRTAESFWLRNGIFELLFEYRGDV